MSDVWESVQREEVGPEERLSRLLFWPEMYGKKENDLVWDGGVFQFPREGNCCESLTWRKYKPTIADVHALGCEAEVRKAGRKYTGAATARAGDITNFRNVHGYGFRLVHEPDDGIHHVHVCYSVETGSKPTRNDKSELRLFLKGVFTEMDAHSC